MKKAQQVFPMIGIFNDAFNVVPLTPDMTPLDQSARIDAYVRQQGSLDSVDKECAFAAASFRLIAFSSYRKAELLGLALPRAVTRRSLSMIDTAWLEHTDEQAYHASPIAEQLPGMPATIRPDLLVATDTVDGAAIDYGPALRSQLDARGSDNTDQCPAPRRTLENFYKRYVEVVLPPDV